jgi:uncharacterized protein YndB with AHSA1/START domain
MGNNQEEVQLIFDLGDRENCMTESFGVVVSSDTIRFERLFPLSADELWKYFADPEFSSKWLLEGGAHLDSGLVDMTAKEKDPEGKSHRIIGLVQEVEPGRLLSHSWFEPSQDTSAYVRFELKPQGDQQTLLILTHTLVSPEWMRYVGPGWHLHLDMLLAVIKGEPLPEFDSNFAELFKKYSVVLLSAGIVAGAVASPAAAQNDGPAYQAVNTARANLLAKYDHLFKDADAMQREMDSLKKVRQDPDVDKALDRLDRDFKDKVQDLRGVELDIKELDKALIEMK